MRYLRPSFHFLTLPVGLCTLATLLCGLAATPAQAQQYDPVEDLRLTLQTPSGTPEALQYRDAKVKEAVADLTTLTDIRRGLALSEWKDNDRIDTKLADTDRKHRTALGTRLVNILQASVAKGDADARIATAVLIGEIGTTIRSLQKDDANGIGRSLVPLLQQLLKNSEPRVRQEAARALGKVNAEPKEAAAALAGLLASSAGDRRAAAEGLSSMVRTVYQLLKKGQGIETNSLDLIQVAQEVVPAAGKCLKDSDAQVRRFGSDAIFQAGVILNSLIGEPYDATSLPPPDRKWTPYEKNKVAEARQALEAEAKLIAPLVAVLKDQGDGLAGALADADLEVRVLARRSLEMLGSARQRKLHREESVPTYGVSPKVSDKAPTDALFLAVKPGLLVIAKRATDPDVRVRRATLDFLEAMEDAAAPAVPTLVAALADDDLFIRWQAARTLGKVGPIQTDLSVPALARVLHAREDPDVREAAASTLRRYGPVAKAALPALIVACGLDSPVARESAIRAVISVGGPEAVAAVPVLRKALDAVQPAVRRAAAEALGVLGPAAMPALDDLRQHLTDEDASVRTAASEALVSILALRQK